MPPRKARTTHAKTRRPRRKPLAPKLFTIANKSMKRWLARLKNSGIIVRNLPVELRRLLDVGFKDIRGCVVYAKDKQKVEGSGTREQNLDWSRLMLHVHMNDKAPRATGNLLRQLAIAVEFASRAVALMKTLLPTYEFQASVSIDDGSMCITEGWPGDVAVHPEVLTEYTDISAAIAKFDEPCLTIRTR